MLPLGTTHADLVVRAYIYIYIYIYIYVICIHIYVCIHEGGATSLTPLSLCRSRVAHT